MAKSEMTPEDYEDHRSHLVMQRYDVLIAWAVVCCLALRVIVGYSESVFPRFGPELAVDDGAHATLALHGEKATLADEIGLIPKPKE